MYQFGNQTWSFSQLTPFSINIDYNTVFDYIQNFKIAPVFIELNIESYLNMLVLCLAEILSSSVR